MTRVVQHDRFRAWIEQEGSIHMKAVTEDGDPIELTADDAREIAKALYELATELDRLDSAQ